MKVLKSTKTVLNCYKNISAQPFIKLDQLSMKFEWSVKTLTQLWILINLKVSSRSKNIVLKTIRNIIIEDAFVNIKIYFIKLKVLKIILNLMEERGMLLYLNK